MKTDRWVLIIGFLILFLLYIVRIRVVDGYIYFFDYGMVASAFIIAVVVATLTMVITFLPQLDYEKIEMGSRRPFMDLIVVIILSLPCSPWILGAMGYSEPYSGPLAGIFVLLGYIILPFLYLYLRYRKLSIFGFRLSNHLWFYILATLALCFGSVLLVGSIRSLLGTCQQFGGGMSVNSLPLFILFMLVPSSLIQNFVWFGGYQTLTEAIFGYRPKAVIFSIIFLSIAIWTIFEPLSSFSALSHRWMNPIGFVFMCIFYHKTGSLLYPITYHWIANVLGSFPSLVYAY
jgi:hypothetical protein